MTQAQTTSTVVALWAVVDVVLEQTLAAVVYAILSAGLRLYYLHGSPTCESLAQLNHSNEICRSRELVANTPESLLLMLIWLQIVRRGLHLRINKRALLNVARQCAAAHVDRWLVVRVALLQSGMELGSSILMVQCHLSDAWIEVTSGRGLGGEVLKYPRKERTTLI